MDRLPEAVVPRTLPSLVLLAALAGTLPPDLLAQEPISAPVPDGAWTFRAVGDLGIRVATRDLGTNTGEDLVLASLAVRSTIEAAPVIGVGVEAEHRYRTVGVRAMLRSTLAATHSGRPGACILIDGDVCRSHESDVQVRSLSVEALFASRREQDVRVTLSMGAGLRHYDFGPLECAADDPLCQMVADIQGDQLRPLFTFGLGLAGDVEGVPVHLKVQDLVGSFRGGSGSAQGGMQNDLVITLGIGLPFR